MFTMSKTQINELCSFARWADKEARSDLAGAYIVSENDYTSNFTGALRRIVNSNSQTGLLVKSHVLSPPDERVSGCDATIIITSNNHFKIVTFEAKYPRMSHKSYSWDYAQTATGLSHFSDQLDRQKKYSSVHAIFEIFYCDFPFGMQPKYMQDEVSSCVWHDNAVAFESKRSQPKSIWSPADLVNLLKSGNHPIDEILRDVCECSRGTPQSIFGDVPVIAREFSLYGPILHIDARADYKLK